jgi:Dolichyl-phosphate-mannose-protein mannosyltransferase
MNVLARRRESILWLILLGLAAAVRFGPIASGLPYSDYIDEGYNLHVAIRILKSKGFRPDDSPYPPLTSYLTVAAIKAYAPIYRVFHHHKLQNDLPTDRDFYTNLGERYDLLTPPEIIWLGRFAVAGLSVGTVILAGALAKLLGGSRAGFLAMLFTALAPALVSRASNVIVDTTATFFSLATLYFCQRLRVSALSSKPVLGRTTACVGIAAGLSFAGKYTVGAVFAAVLVTIFTLSVARRTKAILVLIAGTGLCLGIVCGVPNVLIHPTKIIEFLPAIARFYRSIQSEQGYWAAALSGREIGLPLMIAGLAGIAWMFWNVSTRLVALSWIAFAFLLLAAVVGATFQPFRNLLSLVPPLCIAAALVCNWFGEYLKQRRLAFPVWVAYVLPLLVALSLAWSSARYLQARMFHVDSRVRAIDWLQQHAEKEETILALRELAILPMEWKRIAATSTVVSWSEAADILERERFDYIVTGELDLRYVPDPEQAAAALGRWKNVIAPFPAQAEFGAGAAFVVPYLWRSADERIIILRAKPAKTD